MSNINIMMSRDNGDWSDLTHDVLSLVMMKLGIVDFVAFKGVCKSWRSLSLIEKNKFMVSKPPVAIQKSPCNKKELYFKDFEGRMSKLMIPHLSNMEVIEVTRGGYLILFRRSTLDLCLVNPITSHELHFPADESAVAKRFREFVGRQRVILVFSPWISGWVLVVLCKDTGKLWFSVAGKGKWVNVFSKFFILDVIAFKGKIYTLHEDDDETCLCELRLHPRPKFTSLKIKNLDDKLGCPEFVSAGENLWVWVNSSCVILELDFGQMKFVSLEKKKGEYTYFSSRFNHTVAVKQELWADPRLQYKQGRYGQASAYAGLGGRILFGDMWYFPHECFEY